MATKNVKLLSKIKAQESTISLILGVLVVFIVGFLLFKYFRGTPLIPRKEEGVESLTPKAELTPTVLPPGLPVSLPTKYVVQKTDSLWKISEKYYGTGYNWVDISRENKLKNPNLIFTGQELNIPNVLPKKPIKPGLETQPITGKIYTVVKGDNLWNISVRAYQDGFKWTEIAKASNLTNPGLIHPGNVLTIPR